MSRLALFSGGFLLFAVAAISLFLGTERAARRPKAAPENGADSLQNRDLPIADYDVRSPVLRALKLRALAGSVEAADELMSRAGNCYLTHIQTELESDRCEAVSTFWFNIALQNGSPAAAQGRTIKLLYSDQCSDIYRAEYWYRRHEKAYAGHKSLLKAELRDIGKKKQICRW